MGRPRQLLLISTGLLLTGIGIVGIITPVLPTTVFLLVAGGLFANASPRLHSWLHRNRITGPYLRVYSQGSGLSRRRKAATIAFLWVTLAVSAWFVREAWWAIALLAGVGVAVTIHIATIRPRPTRTDEEA